MNGGFQAGLALGGVRQWLMDADLAQWRAAPDSGQCDAFPPVPQAGNCATSPRDSPPVPPSTRRSRFVRWNSRRWPRCELVIRPETRTTGRARTELAFSVAAPGVKLPPSLRATFQGAAARPRPSGAGPWLADQLGPPGVLLLNTSLTVEDSQPPATKAGAGNS